MKNLLFISSLMLFFVACSAPESDGLPESLEAKQALLKEKRVALAALSAEIDQIEDAIKKQNPDAFEKQRKLVTTGFFKPRTFKRFVEIPGRVDSDERVNVSSETGGRILKLEVEEGSTVRKGALIATLDLESVNKQIAEVEKSLELATDVYDRQKRLWDQKIGSEIQFLQAKNNKERLEKSLETLRFQLDKSKVYAPISGVVDVMVSKEGEMVAPGTPIVQLLDVNQVKVVADVPESYLTVIKRGQLVTVKFPALEKDLKARVSLIGRTIDLSNRTFKVEVDVPNFNRILKPNLLASMMLNDMTQKDALVLPLELVQQEVGGKDYVLVKADSDEGPIAAKRYVTTGESYDGEIIIEEGLTGEEEIILDGARNLAENELIQIKQPTTENNG